MIPELSPMSETLPEPVRRPDVPATSTSPDDWLAIALYDPNIARSQEAARVLAGVGVGPPGGSIVVALVEALHAPAVTTRRRAANLVGLFGTGAAATLPALIEVLHDPSWTVREASARALGAFAAEETAGEARRALVFSALHDRNRLVRDASARVLARSGGGIEGLASFGEALAHPHASIRCRALRALGLFHDRADEVVPSLARALHDSHRKVRRNAATALGRFGRGALPALPALIKRLHDREPMVRTAAAEALADIGPGLSALWRDWLVLLIDPCRTPADRLHAALERPDLPDAARHEFQALCGRRALWHARRAGLGSSGAIDPSASAWQAACGTLAEAARAAVALAKGKGQDDPKRIETLATDDEAAWLLARLAERLGSEAP
jgi:HEAT repeat protein